MATEPRTITSGFSASWSRTLTDYPTASYSLAYVFRRLNGSGPSLVFTAAADGVDKYTLTLTPAQSATLAPAEYQVFGYILDDATNGSTTKQIVFRGVITVQPDPATATTSDLRSHARRMVDLLRVALEKLASGTIVTMSVQGKTWTQRNLSELRAELARYEEQVRIEDAEARQTTGENPNNIRVRFLPTL